jgi:hypothetical protein
LGRTRLFIGLVLALCCVWQRQANSGESIE